jgi:hypothetical protein
MYPTIKFARTNTTEATYSIVNDLILACSILDINAVEALISEDNVFEGQNKWMFLHNLKKEFDETVEDGIIQLETGTGECNCYLGTPKITFSYKGEVRFGLIIRNGCLNNIVPMKGGFIDDALKYGEQATAITDVIICSPKLLFSVDPKKKTILSKLNSLIVK